MSKTSPQTCARKVAFRSKKLALRSLETLRKHQHGFREHRPYECNCCHLWHIGHL